MFIAQFAGIGIHSSRLKKNGDVRMMHPTVGSAPGGNGFAGFRDLSAPDNVRIIHIPLLRLRARQVVSGLPWWLPVEFASWQRPAGPGTHIRGQPEHPVVHVSWNDCVAYCEWAGVRLPSEAEWEFAARGGLDGRTFAWGDELERDGVPRCNVWRGDFPHAPAAGWQPGPVEAAAFEPNGHGLYNTCGNVWEWCADWFSPMYHRETPALDPQGMQPSGRRSMRGGSFLCHDSYCNRYRVAARSSNTPESSASHIGFRVAA